MSPSRLEQNESYQREKTNSAFRYALEDSDQRVKWLACDLWSSQGGIPTTWGCSFKTSGEQNTFLLLRKKNNNNNIRNETVLLLPKMLLEETQGLRSKPSMSLTAGPMEMTAVTEAQAQVAISTPCQEAASTWSPCSLSSQRSHRKPQSKWGHGTCGSARF